MARYAFRRLIQALPTLLGVVLVTFFLFRILPSDVARQIAGETASAEALEDLRWAYGLDKPLVVDLDALADGEWAKAFDSQLVHHLRSTLTLDFGRSWQTRQPVWDTLLQGVGPSLSLTVPIFFATLVLSISLGLTAAYLCNTAWDRALLLLCVMGMNLPGLSFIVIGQYLIGFRLQLLPVHGFEGPEYLVLPVLIGVVSGLGANVRFYRTVMLEEIRQDHVRTAYALGTSRARVLFVHVLRNALVPIVTRVVLALPFLLLGSLLLESFFGIPGIGYVLVEALTARDYPVVQAMTVIVTLLFVCGNLASDLCYAWIDPRIRLQ